MYVCACVCVRVCVCARVCACVCLSTKVATKGNLMRAAFHCIMQIERCSVSFAYSYFMQSVGVSW